MMTRQQGYGFAQIPSVPLLGGQELEGGNVTLHPIRALITCRKLYRHSRVQMRKKNQ